MGVFGVASGEVVGVAGEEVVHLIGVVDEKLLTGTLTGGFFALLVVEDVAIAVVEAVFADARVAIGLVVHRAVEGEFHVFGAAALGFDLGKVWLGFRFGVMGFGVVGLRVVGNVVEAALEEFFGGGEAVAGLEVGEFALHHVDQESDGDVAIVGFFTDDLGQFSPDAVGGDLGFGLPLSLRLGAGFLQACAVGGAGAGDGRLGLVEAEFDEESGGVDTVAGLEVREFAVHGGDEEAYDEPAVASFLGDNVGESGHIFYFKEDGGAGQRGIVIRAIAS